MSALNACLTTAFRAAYSLSRLLRHVAHRAPHPGLGALPCRTAQAVKRLPLRACVLLDEVKVLDWHEQLVHAGVSELHEFVRVVANRNLRKANEFTDAMVDMHHTVAYLQVAQVRQEGPRDRPPLVTDAVLFVKQVRLGPDLEARRRETETSRKLTGHDQQRRGVRDLGLTNRNGR